MPPAQFMNFLSFCLFLNWWVMGGGTANGSAKKRKQRQKGKEGMNEVEEN